jgi:hypothetical protein
MIPVPVLTPRLSSFWLGLVTPLYARVGRILVESICHETVVRDDQARHGFDIEPICWWSGATPLVARQAGAAAL